MIDRTPNRPSPNSDGGRHRRQGRRNGEDADVDAEVGDHEVAAVVTREEEGDEDGDRGQVGGDENEGHEVLLEVSSWMTSIEPVTLVRRP